MRTRGPGESALLLLDIVEVLDAQEIAYAVIGATAATLYGAMRTSMDADVVISIAYAQAVELESIFKSLGFATVLNRGDFEDPIPGMLRVSDVNENRVDLLLGLRGLESQAYSRAIDVPFEGRSLRFIGCEDFIAMKLFAGGPIDILDATRAMTANRGSMNIELLRRLAAKYSGETTRLLENLLKD